MKPVGGNATENERQMNAKPAARIYHVLFLCTANSARSILAEAILNKIGAGRFRAWSAGSHPRGEVNPHAIALLGRLGFPVQELRSKSWSEFARPGAPALDFVITVCDNAAKEVCPVWPGSPVIGNWSIPDPAAVAGSDQDVETAFLEAFTTLQRRMEVFANLPAETLDRLSAQKRLDDFVWAGGAKGTK